MRSMRQPLHHAVAAGSASSASTLLKAKVPCLRTDHRAGFLVEPSLFHGRGRLQQQRCTWSHPTALGGLCRPHGVGFPRVLEGSHGVARVSCVHPDQKYFAGLRGACFVLCLGDLECTVHSRLASPVAPGPEYERVFCFFGVEGTPPQAQCESPQRRSQRVRGGAPGIFSRRGRDGQRGLPANRSDARSSLDEKVGGS